MARGWLARTIMFFGALLPTAIQAAPPAVDKAKLEAYVRYTEGYTTAVKVAVGDAEPSVFKGFSRVTVHLSLGEQKIDKSYFVTQDGQQFVNGNIWSLTQSPFAETLARLPENGPAFGPADAKVTIVIFSDFQCPYCRDFAKTIRENVPKKYPRDVRVVFEDFPIDSIHKWARAASVGGQCLGSAQAFWSYHDWIFEHQGEITPANVREKVVAFAKTQGLGTEKVNTCMDAPAAGQTVKNSVQAGEALGVQQTPTAFVSGRTISGALPWKSLDSLIQLELTRPKEIPGQVNIEGRRRGTRAAAAEKP